jgi:arylsulfatase
MAENQEGKPGYEGHLRDDVVSLAQPLRDAGYHTSMTGKWHLGTGANNPASRGFEKSFALMNGAASHWADQGAIIPGSKTRYTRDGVTVEGLPADFYSSDYYTDEIISYIGADADAPFFAFLSYTSAHNPLHVPQSYIDKYRGKFDAGWDALAASRLARLKELGLASETQLPHPRPEWVLAWNDLSVEQQASRARDMEIYAGMIDYMDEQIGRVLMHLKDTGQYDNTLVVFISDNGPSKTSITDYLALGGEGAEFFAQFDNSLDNKGLPGSSTDIGPGWAYAAATPLRLFKGYVAQGGIQVPAVIKLPGAMENAGTRTNRPVHITDLMPTFVSIAGAEYPSEYNGQVIVPFAGQSLLPLLRGEPATEPEPREIGWSAYGMDAFRKGDWKVLRLPEPYGNGDWQLYNLAADPGELHDLSSEFPDRAAALAKGWENYADSNGVITPNAPVAYSKPVVGQKH